MEVRGQPACPEVKKRYKKKCCIVYIYSLYMLYYASTMFTCIKVLSRLGRVGIIRTNNKYWVGQDKQGGHKIGAS